MKNHGITKPRVEQTAQFTPDPFDDVNEQGGADNLNADIPNVVGVRSS